MKPEEIIAAYMALVEALHFCRAHLRVRNGKLGKVRAHWRGDPALGVVRSRYSVARS